MEEGPQDSDIAGVTHPGVLTKFCPNHMKTWVRMVKHGEKQRKD
jgi:hypothetical protein